MIALKLMWGEFGLCVAALGVYPFLNDIFQTRPRPRCHCLPSSVCWAGGRTAPSSEGLSRPGSAQRRAGRPNGRRRPMNLASSRSLSTGESQANANGPGSCSAG